MIRFHVMTQVQGGWYDSEDWEVYICNICLEKFLGLIYVVHSEIFEVPGHPLLRLP